MFVSIIIPLYNSEKYIIDALNSIWNQTFKDFECILIDDCSSDNTQFIIEQFILLNKCHAYFKYYKNTINLKQGISRNIGITKTSGKYIMFMDHDDLLPLSTLSDFYEYTKQHDYDLLIGNILKFNDDENHTILWKSNFSQNSFFNPTINKEYNFFNYVYPWSKLYLKQFWENNNFTFTSNIYEDTILWAGISSRAKRIKVINNIIYNFRVGNLNSDGSKKPRNYLQVHFKSLNERLETLKQFNLLNNENYYISYCLADAYQIIKDAKYFWQRYKLFMLLKKYIKVLPSSKFFNNDIIPNYKIIKLNKMYKYGLLYFIIHPNLRFHAS